MAPTTKMICIMAASLTVASYAPKALAQEASPGDARALFEQGVQASSEDRWGDAVALFRQSRAIMERPSAVFNTAVALSRMGRVTEALSDVERYLSTADAADPNEAERYVQARSLRTELQARVATLSLALTPAGAQVEVDGREQEIEADGAAGTRTIHLDPGTHAVHVFAEGFSDERFELTLAAGAQEERAVTLLGGDVAEPVDEEVDTEASPVAAELDASSDAGLGELGMIGIIVAGVGVAAGLGSLITGIMSQSTYDSLQTRCPGGVCPAGSEGDISGGESLAWVSTALLGVTVIGLGVGLALLIVDLTSDGSDEQAVRLVPAPGGAALRASF